MKKSFVIAIAVVLCLAVVGAAFALYTVEPEDKVISISAGDAVRLTIGGLTGETINPDTDMVQTIELSDNDGNNLSGTGTLTIAVTGDLADALTVSFDVGGTVQDKTALAAGVEYTLATHPITGTLTIAFDDTLAFGDYAEATATVTISYEYNEFAPVDGVWYLVGTSNGWAINAGAIAINGTPTGDNQAEVLGVTLAVGEYKAVKYVEDGDNVWAGNDNLVVSTAGSYNIYVNNSGYNYIAAAE